MADVVVTVPRGLWRVWLAEGDAAGERRTGGEWAYYLGGAVPRIEPGERVYVVAHGRLRGYAPLVRLNLEPLALVRAGGAVAVTVPWDIPGFRGWRYRDWHHHQEMPFPEWRTEGVTP